MRPTPQTFDQLTACIGHVAAILEANNLRRPYSDLVLRETHFAHNLPVPDALEIHQRYIDTFVQALR